MKWKVKMGVDFWPVAGSGFDPSPLYHMMCITDTFQDPINARFSPCAFPYISAIPAIVAITLLLGLILQLLPTKRLTPRWLRSFAQEPELLSQRVSFIRKRYLGWETIVLFGFSAAGVTFQTWSVFWPGFRLLMVYPATAWGVATILVAIYRPAKTPKALLGLYSCLAASQLIILVDRRSQLSMHNIPILLSILSALGAIITILLMPLRHPLRDKSDISPAFAPPTFELRSPEDNLTLWQFMSVSWMAPLIKLGNKRQLNDEDVWNLGYEFSHRTLHDEFRELKGSVLRRLIVANGLDLFIISMLSIIELVASVYSWPRSSASMMLIRRQTSRLQYYYRRFCKVWKTNKLPNVRR